MTSTARDHGGSARGEPRPSAPKVLHVTTSDASLELLLRPQLEAFQAAGYEVVTASAPGPYVASLEAAGIRHIPLEHATRSMDLGRDLAMFPELYRMFRRERPDIVHTHNPKPGWFGRIAARTARVPVVMNTVHGLYATESDPRPKRLVVYGLERFASMFSDLELVQNPEDVEVLRKLRVPTSKVRTLGNGVDLERFTVAPRERREQARAALGLSPDHVAVGVVGRLVWEKGLREIFEVARRLPTRVESARVIIAGPLDPEKADGLSAPDLEAIAKETGVEFIGERADIEQVYDALDIYVLASHREGFPRSAMEAAACGLPVIASRIRGCRQVVDHGSTGLLFTMGKVGELTDAICELAGAQEQRRRMGRAARRKAEAEFDQQAIIAVTLGAYGRLIEEHRARQGAARVLWGRRAGAGVAPGLPSGPSD